MQRCLTQAPHFNKLSVCLWSHNCGYTVVLFMRRCSRALYDLISPKTLHIQHDSPSLTPDLPSHITEKAPSYKEVLNKSSSLYLLWTQMDKFTHTKWQRRQWWDVIHNREQARLMHFPLHRDCNCLILRSHYNRLWPCPNSGAMFSRGCIWCICSDATRLSHPQASFKCQMDSYIPKNNIVSTDLRLTF